MTGSRSAPPPRIAKLLRDSGNCCFRVGQGHLDKLSYPGNLALQQAMHPDDPDWVSWLSAWEETSVVPLDIVPGS